MRKTFAAVAFLSLVAIGCDPVNDVTLGEEANNINLTDSTIGTRGDQDMITISGELIYRERIALIPAVRPP